jgi:hypothetical protein
MHVIVILSIINVIRKILIINLNVTTSEIDVILVKDMIAVVLVINIIVIIFVAREMLWKKK